MNATRNGYQMRQGSNNRRPRGRHHGGNGNNSGAGGTGNRPRSAASLRHQSFDSNCGDLRVRGNAWQVYEKYQALARDANASGDRVSAENYLQHAEHYYRIIEAIEEATATEQRVQGDTAAAFTQQPEIPANYYAPAGASPAPQGQTEALVQPVVQPQPQSSPFYTQEEIEEHNRQKPLAMAR